MVKYNLRYKAEKAVTFLGHSRPLLSVVFYRSQKTFTGKERCSLEELVHCIFPPKLFWAVPPTLQVIINLYGVIDLQETCQINIL
jgi:hypothetical protein